MLELIILSNFARDTWVLTAKQQRKLRTADISKPSAHDLWNSIQDNFMEPDKVVVQSAPDEDEEDHEPEDLAEGKLADKIPGKDGGSLVRDFFTRRAHMGAFQIRNSVDRDENFNTHSFQGLPWPRRMTARVPQWKTWKMKMMTKTLFCTADFGRCIYII